MVILCSSISKYQFNDLDLSNSELFRIQDSRYHYEQYYRYLPFLSKNISLLMKVIYIVSGENKTSVNGGGISIPGKYDGGILNF